MKKIIALFLIVALCFVLTGCGKSHTNTTGSSNYADEDVKLNCQKTDDGPNGSIQTYSDFLFNTKNRYQKEIHTKLVYKFESGIRDEDYQNIVNQIGALECMSGDCTGSYLPLGTTNMGFETVVNRKKDSVVITFYEVFGKGEKASKEDIKTAKQQYIDYGYDCN